jgi:hypothetical protein
MGELVKQARVVGFGGGAGGCTALDRGDNLVGDVLVNVEGFGLHGGFPLFRGPRELRPRGGREPAPMAERSLAAPKSAPKRGGAARTPDLIRGLKRAALIVRRGRSTSPHQRPRAGRFEREP